MNTFGRIFRLSSFGESHGIAIGGMVDGCPPKMPLAEADIQQDLDKRRPGQSKWTTQRREDDKIEILSGIFEGKTTGAPIGFTIQNTDARSKDYENIKKTYRPGHADYTYIEKYGIRDYRGGGRASARNTAVWVAGGAIARKYLKDQFGISIVASIVQVGSIHAQDYDQGEIDKNPFFCADKKMVTELEEFLTKLRKEQDSVGAVIEVQAANVPAGWGSPVFARLDADIANAMMSINAVKGVEIGKGFASASQHGSHHRDEMAIKDGKEVFLTNNAGGVLGGISTGQDIVSRIAFKPTSSTIKPAKTITEEGENVESTVRGRHDPCVAIRAVPIVEAMMALVLMDALLLHRGQCG